MSGHVRSDPPLRVADHPFFQGADPAFVERVGHHATEATWEAGEFLFHEGDPARSFYLLFHGKVALELGAPDRPKLTIQTVGPRDVLGWSWLVPPYRWRFDARAVKATRALVLDAEVLREAFEARPEDGYWFLLRLVPVIGERLEMARLQILDIYGV